ncbi:CAP domain-containing protein [Haloferula sp.]|uniref:CAP domain-containing protein n=1 Tax=Haloferula sp. TaxID=2497595 RepID=UPI00329D2EF2
MKVLLVLLLTLAPLQAQTGGAAADFTRKANQWMASTDVSKRQAAYRTWLQMGPDAMPEFEKSLEASLKFHDKAIDKLCYGKGTIKNPYLIHEELAAEIDAERKRIMPLIRTDWKKDASKIKSLRDDMEGLADVQAKIVREVEADTAPFDQAVDSHFAAMLEITRQQERFDTESPSIGKEEAELLEEIVKLHIEGSHVQDLRQRFHRSREAAALLASTNEKNKKASAWAGGSMIDFAGILNGERDLLGLPPLALEEKLSDAAEGHSKDMARLGFFAHESPVPEKKSPWDRARLAGFKGNASGENIFMGSSSSQAAYNAWFKSDGHRFIMMASGPNVLGVGIAGSHWTMMTGKM